MSASKNQVRLPSVRQGSLEWRSDAGPSISRPDPSAPPSSPPAHLPRASCMTGALHETSTRWRERLTTRALAAHNALTLPPVPRRAKQVQARAVVTRVQDLAPGLRRITLGANEFTGFQVVAPDEYAALVIPPPGGELMMPAPDRSDVRSRRHPSAGVPSGRSVVHDRLRPRRRHAGHRHTHPRGKRSGFALGARC